MKIVRVPFALSLALLAALPAFAAVAPPPPPKPPATDGPDANSESWRGQTIGICVGDMREAENVSPDDLEAVCGCAADRLIAGRRGEALPVPAPGGIRTLLGGELIACASERRPAVAAAIARRVAEPPPVLPPSLESKLTEEPGPAPAEPPKRGGGDPGSWFSGLSLPAWLTDSGLPTWAWGMLAVLAFLLIRGLFRRDDRRDLAGPPSSMRQGPRVMPQPPRSIDPPPRA